MKQTVEEAIAYFDNLPMQQLFTAQEVVNYLVELQGAASLPTNSMPGWISVEQRLPTKDDTCDEYYNEVLTIQVGRKRPTFMKFWEIQHCPFTKWWMKITPPESAPTEPKQ